MANETPVTLHVTPDSDKAKARKWFEQAKKVADTKNYDYAIECYVGGLRIWPDAMDEGHKPLWAVATARKMAGKKGLGFLESRKYSTNGKDPKQNTMNAEFQWAHEPGNASLMETVIVCAAEAGFGPLAAWMGPILATALGQEKKVSSNRYEAVCAALDKVGEQAQKASAYQLALDTYQAMVRIAEMWTRQYPTTQEASRAYSSASGKQTIVKGRFGTADSFRDSMKDKQAQADLHDKERGFQSETRVEELVVKAMKEYEADPHSQMKLNTLIDLLTRREKEEDETRAIEILYKAHETTKNYAHKVRGDEIRIKQYSREERRIDAKRKAAPNDEAVVMEAREIKTRRVRFEVGVFEERIKVYPTELKYKFQLAERYMRLKRFDDAIPLFQLSQADGRLRSPSRLNTGKCFLEKGLATEAVNTLKVALVDHEIGSDDTGKELHYTLARALEASGNGDEAMKEYGELIQMDYNYKDARARLEKLRGGTNA